MGRRHRAIAARLPSAIGNFFMAFVRQDASTHAACLMHAASVMDFKAPLYIAWEVTRLCNARCVQCYSDSGPGVRDEGELSTDDALRMIDDLADAGLLILALSGGEPLMRRDIFKLIERARQRGLVVNIASNGAIITPALAARLRSSGIQTVTVSLDGADAETHDSIRQLPGLAVFSLCDGTRTVGEIVGALSAENPSWGADAPSRITGLIDELAHHQLVELWA
jgi:sulfatase maturation enzyme AslB (radical SAM superfamily)